MKKLIKVFTPIFISAILLINSNLYSTYTNTKSNTSISGKIDAKLSYFDFLPNEDICSIIDPALNFNQITNSKIKVLKKLSSIDKRFYNITSYILQKWQKVTEQYLTDKSLNNPEIAWKEAISSGTYFAHLWFCKWLKDALNKDSKLIDQVNNFFLNQAKQNNLKDIAFLVKSGTDLNIQDQHGKTALVLAVIEGHKEMVELLINSKADLNIQNHYGATALTEAVSLARPLNTNYTKIVQLLIKAGADLNIREKYAGTPLQWSIWSNNKNMFDILSKAGAKY